MPRIRQGELGRVGGPGRAWGAGREGDLVGYRTVGRAETVEESLFDGSRALDVFLLLFWGVRRGRNPQKDRSNRQDSGNWQDKGI